MTTKPQDQRDIEAREALQKRGQYRKKPVVIEAVQFTQEMLEAHLFDKALLPEGLRITSSTCHPGNRKVWNFRAGIETLEGFMEASIGDWIITGVKGERYPCKPDIFAATYEPAARPAPEALLWQIMVAGPAGYVRREAFAGSNLAEALENVRKQGFAWVEDEDSGFPDVLVKMAAPEALGAAKGVTVAECLETLQGIVDADWRKWEELASPEEFVRWAKSRCNAILAKAKGEQA